MKANLDNPNPAMGQEQVDEVNVNNIKKIRQTLNATGVNQLLLVQAQTSTAFNSATSAVPVVDGKNMEGAFTSSGGWVRVLFKTAQEYSGAFLIDARLMVDDVVLDYKRFTTAGFGAALTLQWEGTLSDGKHTAKVLFANAAGTCTFSANGSFTTLQVVETSL